MHTSYRVRGDLRPSGLDGIGQEQIEQHWKLYEGYVKNVNLLNERAARLAERRDFGPEFSELKRRLGFEYDGMVLLEHYFGVLRAGQRPPAESSDLVKHLKRAFGGFDAWKEEFTAVGMMRGVGWAILYHDPSNDALSNHWIGDHEVGHPAGFQPLLVMDVWEHAYMVDRGAGGRKEYVSAFLKNVDWRKVEENLKRAASARPEAAHPARH